MLCCAVLCCAVLYNCTIFVSPFRNHIGRIGHGSNHESIDDAIRHLLIVHPRLGLHRHRDRHSYPLFFLLASLTSAYSTRVISFHTFGFAPPLHVRQARAIHFRLGASSAEKHT